MNPRYSVELNNNLVAIKDNTTGKTKTFYIRCFIRGTFDYDEETDKYPNYVHMKVWELHRQQEREHRKKFNK